MSEKISVNYRGVLPDEMTDQQINAASDFLDTLSPDGLDVWAAERTKSLNYNGQDYRMVVDRPEDFDPNKVVVVLSEFGTGIIPRLTAKARLMRDAVDPKATLVIQPSSTIGQPNMNYSPEERERLSYGDSSPIIGRLALTMAGIDNPQDMIIFGPSQGATFALDYAASDLAPDSVKTVIVETPNIIKRSTWQLALDFMSAGKDLPDVVGANFNNPETPFAVLAKRNTRIFPDLTKFILSSLHPDNLASIRAMRYDSAAANIETILNKGGTVIQAWGDVDKVSPNEANQLIADRFADSPNYVAFLLKNLSHAATDLYVLDAALMRVAANI